MEMLDFGFPAVWFLEVGFFREFCGSLVLSTNKISLVLLPWVRKILFVGSLWLIHLYVAKNNSM